MGLQYICAIVILPLMLAGIGVFWITNTPPYPTPQQRSRRKDLTAPRAHGYKTKWSLKNEDTWRFAHRFLGKMLLAVSLTISVVSILVWFGIRSGKPELMESSDTLYLFFIAQLTGVTVDIFATEGQLRRHFDRQGQPKLHGRKET